MCLTTEPARLSNSTLYAAETLHNGKLVHVMGYQNRAENLGNGPNAMILPIPTDAELGPDNVLDTRAAAHVLEDYAEAIRSQNRSRSLGMKGFGREPDDDDVQVFDSGSYTIALSRNAGALLNALDRIPEARRPKANHALFAAFGKLYPDWPLAVCAWDGTIKAEPLLWWYEPKDPGQLFLPALDAHDGGPPKIGAKVPVDHTLVVGSVTAPKGIEVGFRDVIPAHLRPFLASKVVGTYIAEGMELVNGDFHIAISNVASGHSGSIRRVPPPGA